MDYWTVLQRLSLPQTSLKSLTRFITPRPHASSFHAAQGCRVNLCVSTRRRSHARSEAASALPAQQPHAPHAVEAIVGVPCAAKGLILLPRAGHLSTRVTARPHEKGSFDYRYSFYVCFDKWIFFTIFLEEITYKSMQQRARFFFSFYLFFYFLFFFSVLWNGKPGPKKAALFSYFLRVFFSVFFYFLFLSLPFDSTEE